MSTLNAERASAAPARSTYDRVSTAFPLGIAYFCLCVVYLFESWARVTPWLFTDELELTQLSRAIAKTGHAARRGELHSFDSLYVYLTAPWWLIHDVASAYSGIKYADVFVMASVIFPTYWLARIVVGRNAALFAAVCAAAIPSLAYSSYIVEENLAYPYAALCFFLIAKAFQTRGRAWIAGAVVASVVAPAVRSELVMVPVVLLFAALFMVWSGEHERRRRASWSWGDWLGAVVLLLGGIFLVSGIASHHSIEWLTITRAYKDRIFNMGNWAVGSLAIGIGVIPLVTGLAVLFRAPGEEPSRELRVFRSVSVAGLVAFGLYTAMKAAWLSTVFATRVEERNLIYVAPLLFVGTAVVLERRRANLVAVAASALYALYLVGYALYHAVAAPYEMHLQLYSDALGLAILQQANRYIALSMDGARWLLLGVFVATVAVLVAMLRPRRRAPAAATLAAALGVFVVAWTFTGEIAAAIGTDSSSRAYGRTLGHPFTWVDDATNLHPTLYVGEGESDQNPEWMLEFWNRSIERVTSLDGSVQGPGPAGGPNLDGKGTLSWGATNPTYDYAVEDLCLPVIPGESQWPCVDLLGTKAGSHSYTAGGTLRREWQLVRLTHPNRLKAIATGISPDGWTGPADSAYFRFSGTERWLRVVVSRAGWGGPSGPSPVHVIVGKLTINSNSQPILGAVTKQIDSTIDSTQTKLIWVRVPPGPVAVHVVVDKKFVPNDYPPHSGDVRQLGAEVEYRLFAKKP